MPFFDFFSYLSSINTAFRSFVLGSIFSTYALLLYYFQNEINLKFLDLSYLFVIPFAASCVMLLIIPQKYNHNPSKPTFYQNKNDQNHSLMSIKNNAEQEIQKNHLGTTISQHSSKQEPETETLEPETKNILENKATDPKLRENFKQLKETVSGYEKKLTDFEKQIHEMKVTIQDLKRTGVIKNDTYESALTELKAFKSELDNPFNFINKYFEMLDIPGMYNPKSSIKSNGTSSFYDEYDLQKKLNITSKNDFEPLNSNHPAKSNTTYNNKKSNKDPVLLQSEENNYDKTHDTKHKHLKSTKNNSSKANKAIFKPRRVDVVG